MKKNTNIKKKSIFLVLYLGIIYIILISYTWVLSELINFQVTSMCEMKVILLLLLYTSNH